MTNNRRTYPKYRLEQETHGTCRCGCQELISGKQAYARPSCRKRMQRLLDRLEAKKIPPDQLEPPLFKL